MPHTYPHEGGNSSAYVLPPPRLPRAEDDEGVVERRVDDEQRRQLGPVNGEIPHELSDARPDWVSLLIILSRGTE